MIGQILKSDIVEHANGGTKASEYDAIIKSGRWQDRYMHSFIVRQEGRSGQCGLALSLDIA